MRPFVLRKSRAISSMIMWGALCAACVVSPVLAMENPSFGRLFNEANLAYKNNQYDRAILAYEKIIRQGFESGNLYYNLGNSYLKKGEFGKALLNYERAKLFIPADSDLKSNSEYARSYLPAGSQGMAGGRIVGAIDTIFQRVSVNGLTILLSLLYILVLAGLALPFFFKRLKHYTRPVCFFLILLFLSASIVLHRKINYLVRGAIVISGSAQARFEPSDNATTYFTLPEGSSVEIVEKTNDWYKIKRFDGKLGWVHKGQVGLLVLSAFDAKI